MYVSFQSTNVSSVLTKLPQNKVRGSSNTVLRSVSSPALCMTQTKCPLLQTALSTAATTFGHEQTCKQQSTKANNRDFPPTSGAAVLTIFEQAPTYFPHTWQDPCTGTSWTSHCQNYCRMYHQVCAEGCSYMMVLQLISAWIHKNASILFHLHERLGMVVFSFGLLAHLT